MSSKRCCVPGCVESEGSHPVLHGFPHPNTDEERFLTWMSFVGGEILQWDDEYVYRNRRICHSHFETKYLCQNNRISNIAVPTINICATDAASHPPEAINRPHEEIENLCPLSAPSVSQDLGNYSITAALSPPKRMRPLQEIQNITQPLPSAALTTAAASHPPEAARLYDEIENFCPSAPSQRDTRLGEHSISLSRRTKKPVYVTKTENDLLKELKSLKIKLNKCRIQSRRHLMALKTANKLTKNTMFLNTMKSFSSSAKILTIMQFREARKKERGRRFNNREKTIALAIFKKSPKAYRFLRKIFILPAPQTLLKMLSKLSLKPGMNEKIFAQLKTKAEKMKEQDKLCVLLFDEMKIKEAIQYNERKDKVIGFIDDGESVHQVLAGHCLVFMMRGIFKNYKQPLAYTFCSSTTKGPLLAKLIKDVIGNLQDAGFIPIATVCDQGTSNQSAIKYLINERRRQCLSSSIEMKDNVFVVNGQEVVPIYDPPHLLKGVRNNLLTKNLKYELNGKCGLAKWSHIQLLHHENPGYKGIRLIPKLTESHVDPNKFGKMKVKYASQVFSQTVATNMGYLSDKGILPSDCLDTAEVLLFFDKVFDSANGSFMKKYKHSKPLLSSVKPNSCHATFWQDAKKILKTMKFVNKSGQEEIVPSLRNWLWTIEGFQLIIKKIKDEHHITSVWMRHMNQDPLENFFGQIRSHGYQNKNPTAAQFESAFAALLINNLISLHTPGSNCEEDNCQALYGLIVPSEDFQATPVKSLEININHVNITCTPIEQKADRATIIAPLIYVTGYFLKKTKKVFKNCAKCENKLKDSNINEYISRREFKTGLLTNPSAELTYITSCIQDIANEILNDDCSILDITSYIKTVTYVIVDFNMFNCEIHGQTLKDFYLNLTLRFFMHAYCKEINDILCGRRDIQEGEQGYLKKHAKQCYNKMRKH